MLASPLLLRPTLVKSQANEGMRSIAKAKIFNSKDDIILTLGKESLRMGEQTIVILRDNGLKGAPGISKPSSVIVSAGLGKDVASKLANQVLQN